jgi:hypothetical protein
VVQVDKGNGQWQLVSFRIHQLQLQHLDTAAAGEGCGERVADGLSHQRNNEGQLADAGQGRYACQQDSSQNSPPNEGQLATDQSMTQASA